MQTSSVNMLLPAAITSVCCREAKVWQTYANRRAVEELDFGAEVTDNLKQGTHMGPFVKHVNWALTLVNSLPESVSGRWIPGLKARRVEVLYYGG